MKNNKNVHVVETDYYSRLAFNTEEGNYIYKKDPFRYNNQEKIENRDIYITSNGFITENSWICHDSTLITTAKEVEDIDSEWKLVILTTDVDLIKDGVQAIDDEFLEWFVKNPSCKSVTVTNLYGDFQPVKYDYKIIIPKKEPKQDLEREMFDLEQELDIPSNLRWHNSKPKQETLEEAAERNYNEAGANAYFNNGFIRGAKWQQEQIGNSEFLQKLRATKSDAEVRRLIFKHFKNK